MEVKGSPPIMTSKPGWQTTEFYVTILTACLPLLTAVFNQDFSGQVQSWAAVAAGVATAAYAVSRGMSKQSVAKANAMMTSAQTPTQVSVETASVSSQSSAPPASNPALAAIPIDTLATILSRLEQLTIAAEEQRANSAASKRRPTVAS